MKKLYASEIANYLSVDFEQVHLYWKGRVALYAILKAMGVGKGDEVILPAFTCVVVPNAVLYLGGQPIYVDIDYDTYNMDVTKLEASITERTKVVIVQNTFGLSSNIIEAVDIANKYQLATVEDCTHGFGGYFDGKRNGSHCDAAFYSTQWNKPYSTGIGGFSVISDPIINQEVKLLDADLIKPTFKERLSLKLQIFLKKYILVESTYWKLLKLYRYLSNKNVVLGSSSQEETSGIDMPPNFFKASSSVQGKAGADALQSLNHVLALRKINASKYTSFLKSVKKNHVAENLANNHSFLKYPLRVSDRDTFLDLAERAHIPLGDWFISPLHPVSKDLNMWSFDESEFPVALEAANEVVNLPTDVSNEVMQKVIKFLKKNSDLILTMKV